MFSKQNYKMGFDLAGFILFLGVMLPNLIWFAVPAVNDVLRRESVTPVVDQIGSVFQVTMIASLCIIVNQNCRKPMKKVWSGGIAALVVLYYAGWCFYYSGSASPIVILDLCIAPCLAFVLFSAVRKNAAAFLSAAIFMICHVLFGVVNFMM
ncbi:MAG: hypothetical protein NC409_00620 [Clostridium sp.]|nr:hypothetical protein [Clostridium sp.]